MTDEKLLDYSREHLYYELWMLYETGSLLVKGGFQAGDWVLKNALLESFVIHARVITAFLYPEKAMKKNDDVTSYDFVGNVEAWTSDRGERPAELETLIERANKEVAHLTEKRYASGAPEKLWIPEEIVRMLCGPLHSFVHHAVAKRLDISVKAFIAELAKSPADATAVTSTSSLNVISAEALPAKLFVTDVATHVPRKRTV